MTSAGKTTKWQLSINPNKVLLILGSILFSIVMVSVFMDVIEELAGAQKLMGYRVKLDLDQEANIPTHFSSFNLVLSAALLGVIAALKRKNNEPFALHWAVLAVIFLFLSIDETAALHERLIPPIRSLLKTRGIFSFGWVVPAIPFVLITVGMYFRFFLHLPAKTRSGFAVAASFFLAGALGFELVGGWYAEKFGEDGASWNLLTTLEETLEMVGIVVFIYTLLRYMEEYWGTIRIEIARLVSDDKER